MFDAKQFVQFVRSAVRESVTIGESAHPVAEYVTSLLACPVSERESLWYVRTKDDPTIPGHEDLWHIRAKADQVIFTYRKSDRTLSCYMMSFADFRSMVVESQFFSK